MPDLAHERLYEGPVCGVDEVGRGPLAGPVVAAAVIIPETRHTQALLPLLDDSKKLSKTRRAELEQLIRTYCHFAIAEASEDEIDDINILQASLLAMRRAVGSLAEIVRPATALIDGNKPCRLNEAGLHDIREVTLVKGDSLSCSIAAASILAKTHRDGLMHSLAERYPGYGWRRNSGYPTKQHLEALKTLGITPAHRKSFKPICELFITGR